MKKLTANKCIKSLKKFIQGTEWENDTIEWGSDTENDTNYIWNATNPTYKKQVKIICNKNTGECTFH